MKRPEKSHYQSEVFVCVATKCMDVVNRLLFYELDDHMTT